MAVDQELLDILVCPKSKGELSSSSCRRRSARIWWRSTASTSATKSRSSSRVSTVPTSGLVYPIVSDIPIMLTDEALPASAVGR